MSPSGGQTGGKPCGSQIRRLSSYRCKSAAAFATLRVVNQSTGKPDRASIIAGFTNSRHGKRPNRSIARP